MIERQRYVAGLTCAREMLTPLPIGWGEGVVPYRGVRPTGWGEGVVLRFAVVTLLVVSMFGAAGAVFDVKKYGATGRKDDDSRPAIQSAIDACGAHGGGVVRLPAGQYTSGTLHLRSNVRFELEAGATLFAATDPAAYDCGTNAGKAALFFGEGLKNISIGGQGVIDGQAEYEWKPDEGEHIYDHKRLMEKAGKSVLRPFPKGLPKREIYPHLLWLGGCKNVSVTGVSWLHSPAWTITLNACQRVRFDGVYIYSDLKEAVWADGIDLFGCKDVTVANCTIETGDDCVALVSEDWWGRALACENICITNCRLSSASAGIKFSEGNIVCVRDVRVVNTIFNNVNRGMAFYTTMGGAISNVLVENVTMNCNRFDWFWDGDGEPFFFQSTRRSEWGDHEPRKPNEAAPGSIRNITIRNMVARAKGSSLFYGHAENPLDNVTLENVKFFVRADPTAPYDKTVHALDFRRARNVRLKRVEAFWEEPALEGWKSAFNFENVSGLQMDGCAAREAWPGRDAPAMAFKEVSGAVVRHCRGMDGVVLAVKAIGSKEIRLEDNDFGRGKVVKNE